MKRVNIKGAAPVRDEIIEPVEIVISGHFPESLSEIQMLDNASGFRADAEKLLDALRSLPGGTFHQLLALMLQERASHFIVSFDQPKLEPKIAPAPTLLEAAAHAMLAKLEEVEKVISEWPTLHEGGDYLHGWILNSIRDVLAKAKGESR